MKNKMISYISNLPETSVSGGMDGINNATYSELRKSFKVKYVGAVNPSYDWLAKYISFGKKIAGFPRNYHFYSNNRLKVISKAVNENLSFNEDALFFHNITPWIFVSSEVPYFAHADACFATYVKYYNSVNHFSRKDLFRIYDLEALWMDKAATIFFQSEWARQEAINAYGISGKNLKVTGIGGGTAIPEGDFYEEELNFLFISKEFTAKGGPLVVKAFERFVSQYPDAILNIIGEKPPTEYLTNKNVFYHGFLRKDNPDERLRFNSLLAKATAIVHPTVKDINPLVLIEAAYFGCPAISTSSFAIPEIVKHGMSGFLLEQPVKVEEIESFFKILVSDHKLYGRMRDYTRKKAILNHDWQKIVNKMKIVINQSI